MMATLAFSELIFIVIFQTLENLIFTREVKMFVLVNTYLWGRFGTNYPSAFLKIFQNHEGIYPKSLPNQTCDYWLIRPDQQHFVLKLISFNSGQLQISVNSYRILIFNIVEI